MSKRQKLMMKRLDLSMKKNVFSGRFIVRNTLLFSSILLTLGLLIFTVSRIDFKAIFDAKNRNIKLTETAFLDTDLMNKNLYAMEESLKSDPNKSVVDIGTVSLSNDEVPDGDKFVVVVDSLNIRKNGDAEAEVIGHIYQGMTGYILENTDSEWAKVTSGGIEGYVAADYISTDAEVVADKALNSVAVIEENGVNVRKTPEVDGDAYIQASKGDEYPVLLALSTDEWAEVMLPNGMYGFINRDYVSIKSDTSIEAVSESFARDFDKNVAEFSVNGVMLAEEDEEDTDDLKNDTTEATTTSEASTASSEATTAVAVADTTTAVVVETTTQAVTETTTETTTVTTTETTTQVPAPSYGISEDDIAMMEAVMACECGNEPYDGQVALANIILNRWKDGRFGPTIHDVLYYPNQFSIVYSSAYQSYYVNRNANATTKAALQAALSGVNNIGSRLSYRAIWAYDPSSFPDAIVIGNHVFF